MASNVKFPGGAPLYLVLIILLGLIVYSNTIDAPFHFDDKPNIVRNQLIRDVSNIPDILAGGSGPFASRPLMHATFTLNYYLGGFDTRGYHAVNLALHLINGVLMFVLVSATLGLAGYERGQKGLAAVLASMVFLLHPAQTEAVTYVVSRSALLATTFFLLGMYLYAKAVTAERRRGLYIAALFVVSLLGMGSRENFATFAVMVIVYDLLFISRLNVRETLRHYRAYVPVFATLGYLVLVVLRNTYAVPGQVSMAEVAHTDYFLTEFRAHWTYLRLLALPINQNVDYDYPVSHSLFEPATLIAALAYAGLWVAALASVRRRSVAAFSLLWFLVTLLPISFAVTFMDLRLDDVIFEHRLYLPGAGIIIGVSVAAAGILGRLGEKRRDIALTAIAFVLVPTLAIATYQRNEVWKTELSLWEDAAAKSPRKARVLSDLGIAYNQAGNKEMAIKQYEAAITLDLSYFKAYNNLGNIYLALGLFDKAISIYHTAITLSPGYAHAHSNMGLAYYYIGENEKAIEQYREALRIDPYYAEAHLNLGVAYMEEGLPERAVESYKWALESRPGYIRAHFNLGLAYMRRGSNAEARREFMRVLQLRPGDESALRKLAELDEAARDK